VFCSQCGTSLNEDARFCNRCGHESKSSQAILGSPDGTRPAVVTYDAKPVEAAAAQGVPPAMPPGSAPAHIQGYYPGPTQIVHVTQQVQQVAPTATLAPPKSVVTSLVLTFFFGPLGLFYSTITGGVTMLIVSFVAAAVTMGFSLFITWPICMIWGAMAATNHNNALTGSSSVTQGNR